MDIKDLTIIRALELMRSKKLTSHELVTACLENIEKYNRKYNVLITVEDQEKLFKLAREADQTDYSLPLCGIPIVVKDMYSTKDLKTTAGSKVLNDYVPKYDATVISKLKSAGAIIIGKANQDAWAHGSSGENSQFGPTLNAFDPNFVPGGSSSGSAVAVALGMCLAAFGTDTGGSIRVPASYNNLVGLKPTYGRVSRYGVVAMASSLDTMAHVAKDVADSAYLLEISAGNDPFDATSLPEKVPVFTKSMKKKDLKGVKIGVSPQYLAVGPKATKGMDPDLEKSVEQALQVFKDLGAEIVEVGLPYTAPALETYYILVPSEISSNLGRYDGVRFGNGRDQFGEEAMRRIMIGTFALSSGYYDAYYKTAQKIRTLIKKDFENAFKKVDLIFAPVTPTPPFRIGENVDNPMALYLSDIYTVPVNLAGLPAIAIPAGFVKGLPVGVQLIGPQLEEERLFNAAKIYEENTDWLKTKSENL